MSRHRIPVALRRLGCRAAYRVASVWWFVARPQTFGVKLVIRDGERVLFVRHTYGAAVWELPGGGRRRGESALGAARREAREELGLAIEDWREVGVVVDRHYATANLTCLTATYDGRALRVDHGELAEIRWGLGTDPPQPLGRSAQAVLDLP